MPTAGRITAAILFAILSGYVSSLVVPLLPEGRQAPNLGWMNALLGGYIGWRFGAKASTVRDGIAQGLSAAACIAVLALIFHSGALMIRRSVRERNQGFEAALEDFAATVAEFALVSADPVVLAWAAGGATLAGIAAAMAQRRWS